MSPLAFKLLCVAVVALVIVTVVWDLACEAATLCGLRRGERIFV